MVSERKVEAVMSMGLALALCSHRQTPSRRAQVEEADESFDKKLSREIRKEKEKYGR